MSQSKKLPVEQIAMDVFESIANGLRRGFYLYAFIISLFVFLEHPEALQIALDFALAVVAAHITLFDYSQYRHYKKREMAGYGQSTKPKKMHFVYSIFGLIITSILISQGCGAIYVDGTTESPPPERHWRQ